MTHLLRGELSNVPATVIRARDLGWQSKNYASLSITEAVSAALSVSDGEPDAARRSARSSIELAERSQYRFTFSMVYPLLIHLELQEKNVEAAGLRLRRWRESNGNPPRVFDVLLESVLNHRVALQLVHDRWPRLPNIESVNSNHLQVLVAWSEVAKNLHLQPLSQVLIPLLESVLTRGVVVSLGYPFRIEETLQSLQTV